MLHQNILQRDVLGTKDKWEGGYIATVRESDADLIVKAVNAYDNQRDTIEALVAALNRCRALISTLKHVESTDRMSLDAAADLTMSEINEALALARENQNG